jgi:hypothetical protein
VAALARSTSKSTSQGPSQATGGPYFFPGETEAFEAAFRGQTINPGKQQVSEFPAY